MKVQKTFFLALLFLFGAVLRVQYFSFSTRLSQICIVALFLYMSVVAIKYYSFMNSHKSVYILTIMFSISILISAFLNKDFSTNSTVMVSLIHVMMILGTLFMCEYIVGERKIWVFFKSIYDILLFVLVINDVLLLATESLYIQYGELYLLGNKFSIIGLHLLLVAIGQVLNRKEVIFVLLFTMWLAFCLNAITGFLSCIIYLISMKNSVIRKMLNSSFVLFVVLTVSSTVLIINDVVLKNPLFASIISFFSKEANMNSRIMIYEKVFDVLNKSKWWGYGFNNSYHAMMNNNVGVNTQNGILENIAEFGIIGTCIFVMLVFFILSKSTKNKNRYSYPLVVLVGIQFLTSSIEITLGRVFIIYIFFVYMLSICCDEHEKKSKLINSLDL